MAKAFKNIKLQDRYTMFLKETFKCVEAESKTSKYKVLVQHDEVGSRFWFLGKAGAVRINSSNTVATSMDYANGIQRTFLAWCATKIKEESEKI
jgi:hypothetical protein